MKGMNTQSMYKANKSILLTLCLIFMGTLNVQAGDNVTEYGFYVAGKMVTSENCNNIPHVSGVFDSGTAKYVKSTNTLTLTNCTINRTGGNHHAIENVSCAGLIVKFVGTNNLSAQDASAVRFETNGTLEVVSGTTTLSSVNYEGIYLKNADLSIKGPGNLTVESTNDCAIEGNLNNNRIQSSVHFSDGIGATIHGKKGDLVDLNCEFKDYSDIEITLKSTGNSSCPNVNNVRIDNVSNKEEEDFIKRFGSTYWLNFKGGFPVILQPFEATVDTESSSPQSVYYNGSPIYNQNIVVSTRWEVLLVHSLFSDQNFLSYMQQLYTKKYMTKSDVDNCTRLDISGRNITVIGDGIQYLRALKTLNCSNNKLTYVFLNNNTNEALTSLDCSNNQINDLLYPNNVTTLDCSNNKLPSLTIPESSKIKSLTCGGSNEFTSLTITNCSALTTLNCSNSTKLTSLTCSSNSLTSLNVSGCSALTNINCSNNKFTTLTIKGMSKLATLNCYNNTSLATLNCSNNSLLTTLNCYNCALTSLSCNNCSKLETLSCYSNKLTSMGISGCNALKSINCKSNKFEDLTIKGFTKLATLNCSNNTVLYLLDCSNNALTSLTVTGCSSLNQIVCDNNQFTSLSITGLGSLTALSCSYNTKLKTLSCPNNALSEDYLLIDGCTALETLSCFNNQLKSIDLMDCSNLSTLKCYGNQLSSLDVSYNPNLVTLDCHGNKISGNLNLLNQASLQTLNCSDNSITALSLSSSLPNLQSVTCNSNRIANMNDIVSKLPDRMSQSVSGELKVIYPASSSEYNVITQSQVSAAMAKNWATYQYNSGSWKLYMGSEDGISTDIAPIGNTMDEATPLYNLSGQRVGSNYKGVVITKDKKVRMK